MDDMEPTVIATPKKGVPKIIFALLGLVLAAEIVFVVKTFSKPTPGPLPKAKEVSTTAAITLAVNKREVKVGEKVAVKVIVDTGGRKIAGADAVLLFDSKVLEATSGAIVKGSALKDYPFAGIDAKGGIATVSGISALDGNGISGSFILATINFKAKTAGKTVVNVSFTPESTTDSNLVESGTNSDVLEKVEHLSLTIK